MMSNHIQPSHTDRLSTICPDTTNTSITNTSITNTSITNTNIDSNIITKQNNDNLNQSSLPLDPPVVPSTKRESECIDLQGPELQSADLQDPNSESIDIGTEKMPLTAILESLLFVAETPVEVANLAKTLNLRAETVEQGLHALGQQYELCQRGLRLQEYEGCFQLVTAPTAAPIVEAFLNTTVSTRLSNPALESLAIIAYRQPVTRAQIEAIRGVDSSGVVRSLIQRGLVEERGRLEVVGRPILYGVTELFMQHFGLTNLQELPPLKEDEADTLWAATVLENEELTVDS
ncbi:MAG: SMC-Scp complex subunit ScpB [Chloroflexota bacterium]